MRVCFFIFLILVLFFFVLPSPAPSLHSSVRKKITIKLFSWGRGRVGVGRVMLGDGLQKPHSFSLVGSVTPNNLNVLRPST